MTIIIFNAFKVLDIFLLALSMTLLLAVKNSGRNFMASISRNALASIGWNG